MTAPGTSTAATPRPAIAALDEQLVNQIAAGEVIDRPASVVKELVENALDAAASSITVEIAAAGSELIAVRDNGIGMSADQVPQALERHATSKIRRLDDLSEIRTFGFRGEALPSIASVSHLEIVTRAQGSDEGARFLWEGGNLTSRETVGCDVGTAVVVRNLFYNTPARRKFLKTATTELKHIITTVTDFAIAHPRVAFDLVVDGKPSLTLPVAGSPRDRLAAVLGRNLADAMIPFERGDGELSVRGFLAKPEHARQSRDRMSLYVNGRKVFSAALLHAIGRGYGELIPRGKYPVAVCFVTVNPHRIDVNVHPTKREVRFHNDRAVYELLQYGVNQAIFATRSAPEITPTASDGSTGQHYRPTTGPVSAAAREAIDKLNAPLPFQVDGDPADRDRSLYQPARTAAAPTDTEQRSDTHKEAEGAPSTAASPLPELPSGDDLARVWQVNSLYIIVALETELLVLDQHTAHERILYEEITNRLQQGNPESQRLLFAESVELEHFEFEAFRKHTELLNKMGFEVREFGDRTVLLEAAPTGLKAANPVILLRRVLEDIDLAQRAGEDVTRAAAASYACRAAVMAGDVMKPAEMAALYRRLRRTRNPLVCPHGRPTFVRIPLADFDKKFCRA